jgi:hypothetical protein
MRQTALIRFIQLIGCNHVHPIASSSRSYRFFVLGGLDVGLPPAPPAARAAAPAMEAARWVIRVPSLCGVAEDASG